MSENSLKSGSKSVLVKFKKEIMPALDEAVRRCDTDRSKFIRSAVREKARKVGVPFPTR